MRKNEATASVRSAERALLLVQMLAQAGRLRVSQASVALDVAPSTAHRLLSALERAGFARRSAADRSYLVGPMLEAASGSLLERDRALATAAAEELHALADRMGETVHLVWVRERVTEFAYAAECRRGVHVGSRQGAQMPSHATSGGKALLAQRHPPLVDALYRDHLWQELTSRTIRSLPALHEELAVVRRRGWAVNDGETEADLRAVGVAVAAQHSGRAAAVVLAAPVSRVPDEDVEYVADEVRTSATRIARAWSAHC